jgi:hypothetical protein
MSFQIPEQGGGPTPSADSGQSRVGTAQTVGTPRVVEIRSDWAWPAAIAAGLFLVVVVNIVFIWVAVSNADPVVPSYVTEER